jgi:calcium-dependent protein kinase
MDQNNKDWLSHDAKDFVTKCLTKNPNERITAQQCLNHPWLTENKVSSTPREKENIIGVTNNLNQFCKMNSFSKMVISIIASLKVQKDELEDLKEAFIKLDTN